MPSKEKEFCDIYEGYIERFNQNLVSIDSILTQDSVINFTSYIEKNSSIKFIHDEMYHLLFQEKLSTVDAVKKFSDFTYLFRPYSEEELFQKALNMQDDNGNDVITPCIPIV